MVNDGSTDKSRDIMLQFVDKPNVRLLENEYNEGIPISRNRALLVSKGEYIAIHDADDISLPRRFQDEVKYLDSHKNISFMGGHAIKISTTGEEVGSLAYPPVNTEKAFFVINRYKLNPIIDPSCMYRIDTILKHGGYSMDPSLLTVPDLDLWCRLLSAGCLMTNIQEPLIKYRINPSGVTRRQHNKMVESTDLVCAAFRRKSMKDPVLRHSYFEQDSYTEFVNKKEENAK